MYIIESGIISYVVTIYVFENISNYVNSLLKVTYIGSWGRVYSHYIDYVIYLYDTYVTIINNLLTYLLIIRLKRILLIDTHKNVIRY